MTKHEKPTTFSRRALLQGGGALVVSIGAPIAFETVIGVGAANARDYLALDNVICVGGSWVAPDAMVRAGRWDEIEALARDASTLQGSQA